MLNLSDYFAPLNYINLVIFAVFLLCCDIIGLKISSLWSKQIPWFLKCTIWIIGLGIFVFLYFLLHFYLPYAFPTAIYVLIPLIIYSAPLYIRSKRWIDYFKFIKNNRLIVVVFLITLPKVIVKSSLPPYIWDEMAYHYISPYSLYYESSWSVGNGFYQNLPRLLETAYIALFSISKTYSVARLLHFSIFLTFIVSCYLFMKKKFGNMTAFVCLILLLLHPENFLLWSTFGYIDVGTTSLVMLGFVCFVEYALKKRESLIYFSFAFFGMAAGSKYSAITQFMSFLIILLIFNIKLRMKRPIIIKRMIIGIFVFTIFGGYWYIKNLIFTGNPIYPYLFGCRFENCQAISMGYTDPLTLKNSLLIFKRVFVNNIFLQYIFGISILLILTSRKKVMLITALIILLFVGLEIMLVKNISGYEARYFLHWQIMAVVLLVLPLALFERTNMFNKMRIIFDQLHTKLSASISKSSLKKII